VGVTTSKNWLGVIVFVLSVGALWCFLTLLQDKGYPNRSRHLVAQGTLLGIGLALLVMSNSATSRACFCNCCVPDGRNENSFYETATLALCTALYS